jgi:intracellular sulfur oxidation DsrE/DsrF family protein
MYQKHGRIVRRIVSVLLAPALFAVLAAPAMAGGYDDALKGVKEVKAVFDYGQGAPKTSNSLFWAIKNVYEDQSVRALPSPPRIVIVFRGAAVKLISSDRKNFSESDREDLDKFAATIRQLKKDGVKMEVCLYAAKSLGVDPATIMPEVDHVGNGFVSLAGYQAQGYAVVGIP